MYLFLMNVVKFRIELRLCKKLLLKGDLLPICSIEKMASIAELLS